MRRAWLPMLGLLGLSLVTILVVLATPDHRLPAVTNDPAFDYDEAARTLDELRPVLAAEPQLGVDELREGYPLLVRIEPKEPSGILWAAMALGVGLLGTLVLTRSGNRFGAYLLAVAGTAGTFGLARALADLDVQRAGLDLPVRQLWLALADTLWIPLGVILAPVLILVFPNGELLGRRWRWVVRIAVTAALLLLAQLAHPTRYDGRALAPDPGIDLDLAGLVFSIGLALWMIAILAAAASFLVRLLRATGDERAQMTWVAWGLGVAVVALVVSSVAQSLGGDATFWGPVAQVGAFVVLPAAVLVTIFRFRLYEIELVIHKSVLYVALTLVLAGVYAAVLVLASEVARAAEPVPTLLAVVAAAALFEPARARLFAAVDRLVYRRKAQPYEALATLAAELGSSYDLDDGLAAMARAAARGTGAVEVEVWMELDDHLELAATFPPDLARRTSPTFDPLTRVVRIGEAGYLGVGMPRGEALRPREARLLDDLAAAAQQFTENVRLRERLRAQLAEGERRRAELLEARQRLTGVIERTRAELERDLHDGAQARAVSLSAAIGLARAAPTAESRARLLAATDEAQGAVERFARGLYPPELLAGGVGAAMRAAVTDGAIQIDVTDGGHRAAPAVEAALFFVGVEAVQNAMKHAPGSRVRVDCTATDHATLLTVADDGPGFDHTAGSPGHGLSNMRERIDALGGELTVRSRPAAGTTVTALLPQPAVP